MFYPRTILPQLEKELETREAMVLTGMRQSGKTTLLEHLFAKVKSKNKTFLDLEDPINRRIFEEENFEAIWVNLAPLGIKKRERAYIFLDEIQNLALVPRVVKYFVDHFKTKFFLSGSSSYYLKNLFSESMSGRKLIFELFPLTFREFLVFKSQKREEWSSLAQKEKHKNKIGWEILKSFWTEYQEFGGLPAVVLEVDFERKKKLLREIFTSYFEKDVKSLGDFGDIEKLRNLILILAERVGGQLDISTLSRELGVVRETVYNYLSFLEKTYFISLLPRFSRNLRLQAAGNKKLYFWDGGLANVLGRLSSGQVLEQGVFQTLRPNNEVNYYRKDTVEIDFVLDAKISVEVKETADKNDVYLTRKISRGLGLAQSYVVSENFVGEIGVIAVTDL